MKRMLSTLLTACMLMTSIVMPVLAKDENQLAKNTAVSLKENTVQTNTSDESSDEYVPPKFEEGKINVNGYYVVANDGQLSEYLEWSFPYRNPFAGGR